ncbi:MAG: tyrosyl-tRNA synthetase [Patescibacteria group bacterium]|nr:tyrosyl-tRNA synthetase [Patescibacteria group bacterium]MDQ5970432.1 tyrosyl-tRNA synthetase [Patescibacteria group bacterium]
MSKTNTDQQKIQELMDRGTIVEVLPSKKEFVDRLKSGQKLRLYIGIDATAPTLHLSHAKNFMLMEKFRQLGHEVIILFGDFTARIGDPTGENKSRPQLSRKDVIANIKQWQKLVKPLMGFSDKKNPVKIMYNHSWLSKLSMEDLINLASNFTVQQIIERDMFQKRLKEKKPIHLHEFLYPLMQGYDSVAMDVDVEVCGTDQIFNALAGRTLMKKLKNKDKFVVAVTLMENPKTGELMSKSKGTGVFLDTSPKDMYGQVMSQPDEMIEILLVNCTLLSLEEIKKIMALPNPRDAKAKLAMEVTKMFHGEKEALKAEQEFTNIFAKKENPDDMPEFAISQNTISPVELLLQMQLVTSKGEAKRLIDGGGLKLNHEKVATWDKDINIKSGDVIQAGKRKFGKIK